MLNNFEGVSYQKLNTKWFEAMIPLTNEEISGLFGLIEAKEDRLTTIKEICDSCFYIEPKLTMGEAVMRILSIIGA